MKKDITRLLIVLSSAVLFAFAIVIFFLVNFGPTGRYALPSALIEPPLLKQLNYNDYNPIINRDDRYVFNKLVYEKKDISVSAFEKLYREIKNDVSVYEVDPELEKQFRPPVRGTLIVYVHTESGSEWQKDSKIFQEVQFDMEGNYYRVQLHEQNPKVHWVYFYHPGISKLAEQIFTSS